MISETLELLIPNDVSQYGAARRMCLLLSYLGGKCHGLSMYFSRIVYIFQTAFRVNCVVDVQIMSSHYRRKEKIQGISRCPAYTSLSVHGCKTNFQGGK